MAPAVALVTTVSGSARVPVPVGPVRSPAVKPVPSGVCSPCANVVPAARRTVPQSKNTASLSPASQTPHSSSSEARMRRSGPGETSPSGRHFNVQRTVSPGSGRKYAALPIGSPDDGCAEAPSSQSTAATS